MCSFLTSIFWMQLDGYTKGRCASRIANGTVCKFRKLILKVGVEIEEIQMYNYWVNTIGMDNVEYIEVEWEDCDHFVGKF